MNDKAGDKKIALDTGDYTSKIAILAGVKGLKGDIKLELITGFDLIETVKTVKLVSASGITEARVDKLYQEGKSFLLRLKGYTDRTMAEQLLGATVYTQRSQLRDLGEDEWWLSDLIGLPVYTTDGTSVGTISAIFGEANQILEIVPDKPEKPGHTHLVPFVKALVPKVDIKARRVEIIDLPGLLE